MTDTAFPEITRTILPDRIFRKATRMTEVQRRLVFTPPRRFMTYVHVEIGNLARVLVLVNLDLPPSKVTKYCEGNLQRNFAHEETNSCENELTFLNSDYRTCRVPFFMRRDGALTTLSGEMWQSQSEMSV